MISLKKRATKSFGISASQLWQDYCAGNPVEGVLTMSEMVDAVVESYLEHCEREYRRGWEAQTTVGYAESDVSQMYKDGWQDAYAYGEMMSSRRAKQ